MKRFIVESVALLAIALVSRFIATAGYPAAAMFLLATYSIALIGLSQERQFKRDEEVVALRRRLDEAEATGKVLGEALVGAAYEALWVSHVIESTSAISYVIETPLNGRLVVNLPIEEDAETDADVLEASKKG